jgi:Polysaccharide deacetylase
MSLRGAVGGGVGRAGRRMLYGTRGVGRLSSRLRPRACVLMYHRVASPVLDPFGQAVAQKHFVEHLEAVRSRFHVVSVAQLIDGLRKGDYPDGAVAVTFDDGYADTLATAYPAAAALGVPFHVFVTAGPVSAEEQVVGTARCTTTCAACRAVNAKRASRSSVTCPTLTATTRPGGR